MLKLRSEKERAEESRRLVLTKNSGTERQLVVKTVENGRLIVNIQRHSKKFRFICILDFCQKCQWRLKRLVQRKMNIFFRILGSKVLVKVVSLFENVNLELFYFIKMLEKNLTFISYR